MIDELGGSSPQGPLRDELLLGRKLDECSWALSEMIDGDSFWLVSLIEVDVDDRWGSWRREDILHDVLIGSWRPNYRKWLAAERKRYPLPGSKKAIEAKIDDEARAYQARWEKEHGRPWPGVGLHGARWARARWARLRRG
jgi:hypothetical protein